MVDISYALIGYGKMGKVLESLAKDNVVSIVDPDVNEEGLFHNSINENSMKNIEVAIDFTVPKIAVENIEKLASFRKDIVVGTTGWYSELDKVREIVKQNNIGLIYAPNFSIGVNIFFRIVRNASRMINKFNKEYDPFLVDFHHIHKLDSSGTGGSIADILLDEFDNKNAINRDERKREPNEIDAKGIRAGTIPGTHIVGFDSEADTISLKHAARSRVGFAKGALQAADWIKGKKGVFTIDDMMNDIVGGADK